MRYIVIRDARFCRISRSGKRDYRSEIDYREKPLKGEEAKLRYESRQISGLSALPVVPAKAGIQECQTLSARPPCSGQGQALDPRFRGGDDQPWVGHLVTAGPTDTVTVAGEDGSVRLDRWFKRHYPALGHGRLEKLLRTGRIRVDGKRARSGDRLAPGQVVRVPALEEMSTPAPQGSRQASSGDEGMLRDAVLHRDDAVIVLNKPPGLAVQGGSGTERHLDGLLDALRFGSDVRPRLVHWLDKDTSGVLVIARTVAAAAFLTRAFRERTTRKIYWAIVVGVTKMRQGLIDLALAKLPGRQGERVRADAEEGRRAITYYHTVESVGSEASWLALLPVTGRTHQLRAHCAALGTPILGDAKYGNAAAHLAGVPGAKRVHLHARSLSIPHPLGGTLRVTAPLPRHMRQSWEFFGFPDDVEDPFADLSA